ncbi:MAG: hypothetical protein J0H47_05900 [Gammaproteobacteria bacterium]|nr:hypothetical protein [Gammaproteobacteria bacterium]
MINADQVALRAFHYKSTPTELCLPFGTNSLVIELRNKQGEITQESIVDACSIIDDYIFQLTIREFQARAENFLPGIMHAAGLKTGPDYGSIRKTLRLNLISKLKELGVTEIPFDLQFEQLSLKSEQDSVDEVEDELTADEASDDEVSEQQAESGILSSLWQKITNSAFAGYQKLYGAYTGYSVLHEAILNQNATAIQTATKEDFLAQDRHGNYPVHYAAVSESHIILHKLFKRAIDLKLGHTIFNHKNHNNENALFTAVKHQSVGAVVYLLNFIDPREQNNQGKTAKDFTQDKIIIGYLERKAKDLESKEQNSQERLKQKLETASNTLEELKEEQADLDNCRDDERMPMTFSASKNAETDEAKIHGSLTSVNAVIQTKKDTLKP